MTGVHLLLALSQTLAIATFGQAVVAHYVPRALEWLVKHGH